jgi:arsenite methyltransferase
VPPSLHLDTPELAEKYDQLSDKQFEHGKLLLADLGLSAGQQVLDIGCGTGRLGEYAIQQILGPSGALYGIEPLSLRVAIARRRASRNHHVDIGRAENLSRFADAQFDTVYLNSVYHWLGDKKAVLDQAWRVLKPGGHIGISVASEDRPHDVQRLLLDVLVEHALLRSRSGATPQRVGFSSLASQLEGSGFLIDQIKLRSFGDTFPDPEAVLDFNSASSFGNYLSDYLPEIRDRIRSSLRERLARLQTPQGISVYRHLLFAVAHKPG